MGETQSSAPSPSCSKADRENIQLAIKVLFQPGQVVEIRVPKAGKYGTISGYFDDHSKLAVEVEKLSGNYEAVYYTLNPVNPALLARANNRAKPYAKGLTTDEPNNIIKRLWLLIDCDPVRPSGIASTDGEKKLARETAKRVRDYLRSIGWPDPVPADSGNGYHLLYRIDLPNDVESRNLVESVLKALAAKFDTSAVKIDQKVFNASRITKAYGTMTRKGDGVPERPHRISGMFTPPDQIETVSKELLEALAAEAPKSEAKKSSNTAKTRGGWTVELCEATLDKANVNRGTAMEYKGATKWQHNCLSNPEHRKPDAFSILDEDGYLHHYCSHNSCSDKTQEDWRKRWEERTGEKYPWPGKRISAAKAQHEPDRSCDSNEPMMPNSWDSIADELDSIRCGTETMIDGEGLEKKIQLPQHIAEERTFQFVKDVFEKRGKGKFFFDAYPYIYLPDEQQVIRFHDDFEAAKLLSKMRLRIKQHDTALVRENLHAHIIEFGEPTRVEKLGCLRGNAIYINNGRGGMFKITAEEISQVPNGTDGVLLFAPDVIPFPELDEVAVAVMQQKLKGFGGKVLDTRLCHHLNAHFDESGKLSQGEYQQLVLLRFLGLFLGDYLALRPIMVALGEQNSGKSTLWEKYMWIICGIDYESSALPAKLRDFIAAMTNNAVNIFDNIDSVNFENQRSDYPAYIDLMCKASTGGRIPIAQLYQTNVQKMFSLRCNQFLTARVNPFPSHRSDLGRRTIFVPMRIPSPLEYKTPEQIKRELLEDMDEIKVEILVRLQNIVRALVANEKNYAPVSQMHSFETYTMRIADFEGWAGEMTAVWQGYMAEFQNRMTEDSPFVECIRRWVGMTTKTNVGRWARAGEIYADLEEVYRLSFTKVWRTSANFGKRLKENKSALGILGVETKTLHGNVLYKFDPSPEQAQRCRDSWLDSASARYLGDEQLGVIDDPYPNETFGSGLAN